MNNKQRKLTALFVAAAMALSSTAYAAGNNTKKVSAAETDINITDGASYGSGGPSVGSMRDYIMEKVQSPCITLEIGVGGCPLPTSQFASIWRKNQVLVLREAKLLS